MKASSSFEMGVPELLAFFGTTGSQNSVSVIAG